MELSFENENHYRSGTIVMEKSMFFHLRYIQLFSQMWIMILK